MVLVEYILRMIVTLNDCLRLKKWLKYFRQWVFGSIISELTLAEERYRVRRQRAFFINSVTERKGA
jgi:hypothetical protein